MRITAAERPRAVRLDLLMAVMNSLDVWADAAGDRELGLAWRDATTSRIVRAGAYRPYEQLVAAAAAAAGVQAAAIERLSARWSKMEPWPDASAVLRLALPYAFVTNSSARLAQVAADRSGLSPRFVLSAEEAGFYKPESRIYLEACRRLGVTPDRVLFIAGSRYDAIGADAAGLRSVLVARRSRAPLPGRIATVTSLDELVTEP